MDKNTVMTLGENALGTIEAGPDQQERLDEFQERLETGEFHVVTNETIPCLCIDGRCELHSINELAPNTAGGTESFTVADDLTTRRWFANEGDRSILSGYERTLKYFKDLGYRIGGHTDSHIQADSAKNPDGSGCGANDKLDKMYAFIAQKGDVIREVAAQLGIEVDEATHGLITGNAQERVERADFSTGKSLLNELEANDGEAPVLEGDHKEVVAVINTRKGTTLDRQKLREEFGPNYQAFNVDVWSFINGAKAISTSEDEAKQTEIAMVYYNLAAAYILGGPTLRIAVIK